MIVPFGKTITIVPQTVDGFGTRTPGTPVDVDGCAWWQTTGTEVVGGQDTVVYEVNVLAPAGTAVASTDRVILDDVTYEVVGQPIAWESSLTGRKPGVQIVLRKVVG